MGARFAKSLKRKSGKYVWECFLRVWDNGVRNTKLDWTEFIDLGALSEESSLIWMLTQLKNGVQSLFE